MKNLAIVAYGLGAILVAQHSPEVFAQATQSIAEADTGSRDTLESVIVTGTRQTGLKAVDSAAPIQIIDAQTLKRTGQTDVMQALATILPSFTAEATGFDTANLTLSARLRGLSPNDALVLVNGKRRHTTANLHVDGGSPTSGAATSDLSLIPLSLVDHVEVLLDGAAAQYGTDAIAGVINIILKRNTQGGSVDLVGGAYYDEGGKTGSGAFNAGFEPIAGSYINISLEQKYHGFSNRGRIDARFFDPANLNDPVNRNLVNFPGYPYSNRISGDAQYHATLGGFNAGYDVSDALQFYSFGTVSRRVAQSYENYRLPSRIPQLYPLGFNPKEALTEHDFGLTFGAKGVVVGWNYDLSVTHGSDINRIGTLDSGNASIVGQFAPPGSNGITQTNFYDGTFRAGQTTSNFDVSRDFDIGLAGPLSVAGGFEYRTDRYAISPGDPQSYYQSGASSFAGYSDANSGSYNRNDKSAYVDFALTPLKGLLVDIAGRIEKYSDFGTAKVGKGTVRYDFTPSFALRGTFSNGFRAPTLAEQYYSGQNVGPDAVYLQLPPNSQGAKAFGLPNLQPETSINISAGLVLKPIDAMVVTLDAYQISLKNRIVASGTFFGYLGGAGGVQNPAIISALTAQGINPATYTFPDGQAGVQFFTNGADTRTHGVDLVVTYFTNLGSYGSVDWSVGGNYTNTTLTKVGQAPAILGGGDILDAKAASVLTMATPKYRIALGGLWRYGPVALTLRETFYGKSGYFEQGDDGNYYKQVLKAKAITDLELSYQPFKAWTIAAGAKNLFNTYPTKLSAELLATQYNPSQGLYSNSNVSQYPQISPYGINGGYYYGRLTYAF